MRNGCFLVWALFPLGSSGAEPVLTIPEIVVEGEDRALEGPAARDPGKATLPESPLIPLDKASGPGAAATLPLPAEASFQQRDSAWLETSGGNHGVVSLEVGSEGVVAGADVLTRAGIYRRSSGDLDDSWLATEAGARMSRSTGQRASIGFRTEERTLWGAPHRPLLKTSRIDAAASMVSSGHGPRLWGEATYVNRELSEHQGGGMKLGAGISANSGRFSVQAGLYGEPDVTLGKFGGRWSRSVSPRAGFWAGASGAGWKSPAHAEVQGVAWPDGGVWWSSGEATWTAEIEGDASIRGLEETLGRDATPMGASAVPQVTVTDISGGLTWEHSSGFRLKMRLGTRRDDVEWVPSEHADGTWERRARNAEFREVDVSWIDSSWKMAVQWVGIGAAGDGEGLLLVPERQWTSSVDTRRGDVRAGGTLRGAATARAEAASVLPSWWTLDLRAGWAWSQAWELGVLVQNVFDTKWSRWPGYSEPGIGWSLSMGRRWEWVR